ncbi:MAG TPA: DUF2203 domain-containing protein [Gemmatimonadaceae bacterium]|nr:DUF2203 domain-containing protein [Gemmatimonadaceae bacterium]
MPKTFTVEQANRTLPLVSRIVHDIVTLYPRWCDRMNELELLAGGARSDASDPRIGELEAELQEIASEIDSYIGELAALGVEYKQPIDAGLVDFPGIIDGRRIYYCWRVGEPAVDHWHELDAGFAGRRSVHTVALA